MQVLVAGKGRPYLDGDSLDWSAPIAFTVNDVMSTAECAELIARIDEIGPEAAPITTGAGFVMRPEIRNNTRVIFDDMAFAQRLFERVAPALPQSLCGMTPVGANERFRCYRYAPGQKFAPHYDGAFVRNARERSLLTFMVYLNEGFTGGRTAFHDFDVTAIPRTGSALLFQHQILHEGCRVETGVKYVLRSDVMYR
jgi:prolyl 4-hydroxylase